MPTSSVQFEFSKRFLIILFRSATTIRSTAISKRNDSYVVGKRLGDAVHNLLRGNTNFTYAGQDHHYAKLIVSHLSVDILHEVLENRVTKMKRAVQKKADSLNESIDLISKALLNSDRHLEESQDLIDYYTTKKKSYNEPSKIGALELKIRAQEKNYKISIKNREEASAKIKRLTQDYKTLRNLSEDLIAPADYISGVIMDVQSVLSGMGGEN